MSSLSAGPAAELGERIRALRLSAGLTGTELAERLHVSQSKISKIETGRLAPSAGEVRSIAGALEAPAGIIEDLAGQAEHAARQARNWRARPETEPRSSRVSELESSATLVQAFRAGVVPELLQTADYARQLLRQTGLAVLESEATTAVEALSRRQAILFDPGRQFEFVMWEAVLRQRLSGPEVMGAQLDRLLSLASLPNLDIGILAFDIEVEIPPLSAFSIFDGSAALVETGSSELLFQDLEEVRFYAAAFASYRRAALFGDRASEFLVRLASRPRLWARP
ncbi:MAG: helix-turn-helix transcriptional regulator [Candidatus Dormibacteraeota bacterium]|nr:helix-turn-helix transcriptional regulator [Candidatus Dormibacteraeota bacterium]